MNKLLVMNKLVVMNKMGVMIKLVVMNKMGVMNKLVVPEILKQKTRFGHFCQHVCTFISRALL